MSILCIIRFLCVYLRVTSSVSYVGILGDRLEGALFVVRGVQNKYKLLKFSYNEVIAWEYVALRGPPLRRIIEYHQMGPAAI